MKKISFLTTVVLAILFLAASAFAMGIINVNWSKNTEPDIVGYNIYYGTSSGSYTEEVYADQDTFCIDTSCSYQFSNLQEGQIWYFVLKAVDGDNQESTNYSDEVFKYLESSYTVGGISLSQLFQELSSGVYRLTVMADGTYDVEPLGNSAPVVSISTSVTEVIEGEAVIITASASDPEGDPLIYSWYVDGILDFSGDDVGNWADWTTGSHSVYCIVDDGTNTVQSNIINVTILAGPHISVPEILVINATYGDATATGNIQVANAGNGDIYWWASTTSGMLSLSPDSGTNTGTVVVTADLIGLDPGDYYGDVVITSSDADNSPQTVPVVVSISDVVNEMSVDLDGNAYLSIADTSQTGLDVSGDFKIEARIKLKSYSGTISLINKWGVPGDLAYYWYIYAPDNEFGLNICGNGVNNSNVSINYAFSTGIWYDIGVVYDASAGSAKFYVGKVQQGTTQTGLNTSINKNTAPFIIGSNYNGGSPVSFFDGLMDDVRIWNKGNLVGYWKFDDDLSDFAGGNTLINNGTVFSTDISCDP